MFDRIAPRYDLVNRVITLGLDNRWRRDAIRSLGLPAGAVVADVACGTGDLCRIAKQEGLLAVGFDYSGGMLARAATDAPLVQADGLALPLRPGSVDGVTCGFALRNVTSIDDLFGEFARVLAPGGRLAILEVAQPRSKILRRGHHVYMNRLVPLLGGILSDRDAYRYLPESAVYLPPTPKLLEMLESTGFTEARSRLYGMGAAQLLTATRSS